MKNEPVTSAGNCPVDGMVRPVAWVRDLGPQPHWVTNLRYCSASDVDSGAHMQYMPLYDQAALDAAVAAERERCEHRDDIHTESSRIYARLACAVRTGADDAALARLLRHEVNARAAKTEFRDNVRTPIQRGANEIERLQGCLLWLLWHHQGSSSPIGQPIRRALGIDRYATMTEAQIEAGQCFGVLA